MTDEAQTTGPLTPGSPVPAAAQAPSVQEHAASSRTSAPADRPEIIVGAAFAAGFTLAMLFRRLVR
ncbi:MAG: hypothetical protein ACJ764_04705 [Solirubrobacteraceae bacterium]